ncbi:hypothetical protein, partial [Nocardia cyriacigeorgica]|uniref:hypothetical protein n=1 Tax=Nocardia cyriacigeorgica TaxID=135487 RepID=UPI002456B837
MNTVPGRMLTDPDWLTARIAEMGRSWGTGAARVGGTLWWCMVASALVEPVARAYAAGERAPLAQLDRIGCDVRPDGGVDRIIFIGSSDLVEEAAGPAVEPTEDLPRSGNASIGDHAEDDHPGRSGGATTRERAGSSEDLGPSGGSRPGGEGFHDAEAAGDQDRSAPARSAAGTALHDTLAAVIAQIAAVSGAGGPPRGGGGGRPRGHPGRTRRRAPPAESAGLPWGAPTTAPPGAPPAPETAAIWAITAASVSCSAVPAADR